MNHLHPPEGHPPPPPHSAYESKWRPTYLPPYEHPDSRRLSAPTQGPSPPQGYPMQSRELPQLPPDGPYGRPNSLPGPSHPPHPPHPISEPSPLHTGYRPPMNGSPSESSPHSATPDYRSRMAFPPPEPQVSSESTPPISSHLPPTTQYMQAPPPPPSAGTPTSYDAYYNSNAARQRKANRATQACDQCRARKAKCDEGRPSCSHCKENGITCVYKEIPPHKQEKGTQQIIDKITETGDSSMNELEKIRTLVQGQDTLLAQLVHSQQAQIASQTAQLQNQASQLVHMNQMIAQLLGGESAASASNSLEPPMKSEPPSLMMKPEISEPPPSFTSTGPATASDSLTGVLAEDMKNADNEGELSIPVEHTTAAHKLLMWPVIKNLISPKEYDEDYVMRLEEERGLISVRGQGENSFSADGTSLPPQPHGLGNSFASDDGILDANNESMSGDFEAEITRSGLLNLEPETARRYFQSYMERMYVLHPFLDEKQQRRNLDEFLRCYCPLSSKGQGAGSMCQENNRSAKRQKRSHEPPGVRDTDSSSNTRLRVGMNIDNAVLLLILAVGAICDAKHPLPGPIMDEPTNYLNQYVPAPWPPLPPHLAQSTNTNGISYTVLSPATSDSATMPQPTASFYNTPMMATTPTQSFSSSPATMKRDTLSRRPVSNIRDEYGHLKNLEVIPGLALYGYATAILGHLQGGVELEHVQAGLLAGLYASQLAHPFQSHGWICQAARACQVLVRQRRYERFEWGITKDLYNFAYWTCLQLESDLLAELDIPASGISRFEGRIDLPKGKYTIDLPDDLNAKPTRMMLHYSAQIHLRKVLNRVHTDLYKVEKNAGTGARWSSSVQEALSMNLDLWRDSLPNIMKWKDEDPPATEINAARMRAKYYGARYIIHRPLLFHALHHPDQYKDYNKIPLEATPGSANASHSQQMSPSMTSGSARGASMARMKSELGNTPKNLSPEALAKWETEEKKKKWRKLCRACKVCVESAILSTEAFDGMEDRLVVTNIFGTAHAQFGNMLVLSATYMSELNELVERPVLEALLRRTIRFLLHSKNISPTLRADARILTEIYEQVFGNGSFRMQQA
ncbi:hypothetical protein N7456_011614 [Penicillium angulare]|uniref:Zn(2)-C6 fungal-type domain-containing protein n=1 Tax=Penicillium angulare TaxID=116970 RepID=A0A9W9EU53_9EURO|nr:hypothetical protein N7456_011614 [Penicillium angulare]